MKVALLSPFIYPIAEPFVGGTEASVYRLASELSRQGAEVVCYACEGSSIPGVEIRTCGVGASALAYPRPPHEMNGDEILSIRAYEDTVIYQAIGDAINDPSINILHNNSFSGIPFLLSRFLHLPMLHTLRLPPMLPSITETLRFCKTQDISLEIVALSHTQAQLWLPYYPVSQIIYNGLDFEGIPSSLTHNGTLAFVGRIDPSKGVEDAIEVANYLGKTLSIYGEPQPSNTVYFEKQIQPLLQRYPNIQYYGLVDQQTLYQRLMQAQALVFPVKWEEPFGNVIIEAMAVGTPVVMYDRGSARELIAEGVSGYVVSQDKVIEMASAVEQTEKIDRSACADYAREHFSLKKTITSYLNLMHSMC